jgi:hypothetical protein
MVVAVAAHRAARPVMRAARLAARVEQAAHRDQRAARPVTQEAQEPTAPVAVAETFPLQMVERVAQVLPGSRLPTVQLWALAVAPAVAEAIAARTVATVLMAASTAAQDRAE